ncbi:hypothetical protein GCM10011324_05750 [Allosediminivita pacifica]|nr:hypothetical protein [Allosediminivita pacifica]GGA98332.1 hypothetical protein GCM10011324_05750 [Allosediminivita pacifica]
MLAYEGKKATSVFGSQVTFSGGRVDDDSLIEELLRVQRQRGSTEEPDAATQWYIDRDLEGLDWRSCWRDALERQDGSMCQPEQSRDNPAVDYCTSDEDIVDVGSEAPEYLNDAELMGAETPAFNEMLGKQTTLLIGNMWGAKDRRNTQDGDWESLTLTWGQWIQGQDGGKNSPTWGFSRHPEDKHKAGVSMVLGSSIDGARKAKAMDTMYAMGLDIDSGAKLDDVIQTL